MSKLSDAAKLLGFDPDAGRPTLAELKLVYRRHCAKHHPDRGGDRDKFDKVNKAYRVVLADISKTRKCELCSGTGRVTAMQGFFSTKIKCTLCNGTGVEHV